MYTDREVRRRQNVAEMSQFHWTAKRNQAAALLADGYTQVATAETVGVNRKTIERWRNHPDFAAEVDRLSLMTDIASRAERLRIAKRVARQKVQADGTLNTEKDLLDWLKFAQGETDGIKLDLAALREAAASVAGEGSD